MLSSLTLCRSRLLATRSQMKGKYTQGGIAAAVFSAAFISFVIGIAIGSGSLDGIKQWQTIVAAVIALLAATIAYWNTSRQIAVSRDAVRIQQNEVAIRRLNEYRRAAQDLADSFSSPDEEDSDTAQTMKIDS